MKKTAYDSSQRFHINSAEKVNQCSECSQRFPFNSSEVKQHSEFSQ